MFPGVNFVCSFHRGGPQHRNRNQSERLQRLNQETFGTNRDVIIDDVPVEDFDFERSNALFNKEVSGMDGWVISAGLGGKFVK